ncbi:flippase [bacterium]|nr:flippase [bacterium]
MTQRIARNFMAIVLGEAIGKIVAFFAVTIFLANYLTNAPFGSYSIVISFTAFFMLFASFGLDQIIVRELSRTPELRESIIGSALFVKAVLSVIAFGLTNLLIAPLGYLFSFSSTVNILARIASFGLLLSPFSVFGAVLHFRMRLDLRSLATVLARVLGASAIVWLIIVGASLEWFIIAGVLVGVPGVLIGLPEAALLYCFYRRGGRVRLKVEPRMCLRLLRESLPIAVCALFIMTYARIDQLMLQGMLKREALVGIYGVAVRYAEVLRIVPLAFIASVFPALCRLHERNVRSFEDVYSRSFKYMNMVCIPVAFAGIVLSKPAIALFNPEYPESAPVLTVLLFAEVFVFLGIVNNRLLISSGRQTLDYVFTGSSALINVALNLLLIGHYGLIGAAIASLIAYAIGPIIGIFIPFTRPFSRRMFTTSVRPFAASIAMLAALWLSLDSLGLIGSSALGILVYLVALVASRGVDRSDLGLVKKLLGKETTRDG